MNYRDLAAIYEKLSQLSPDQRTSVFLDLVEACSRDSLVIGTHEGRRAIFDQINLSSTSMRERRQSYDSCPVWWDDAERRVTLLGADLSGCSFRLANLQGVSFQSCNLVGVNLGGANLQGADLSQSNLYKADLVQSNLQGASLGNAVLREALLDEANLNDVSGRFVDLTGSFLDKAHLENSDLWGAQLGGASLVQVSLTGAILQEANFAKAELRECDLHGADLSRANFQTAIMRRVRLDGATLWDADLRGADLSEAYLRDLDLERCGIENVSLAGAWLERTRVRQEQFGPTLGEELRGDFVAAARGYSVLERNFQSIGDRDAATWAYLRRRRMQKAAAAARTRSAFERRQWRAAVASLMEYVSSLSVEILCNYGESVPRVFGALLCLFLGSAVIFGVTNSVVRVGEPAGTTRYITHNPFDLLLFNLMSRVTLGPSAGLDYNATWEQALSGIEAFLGVALIGLLGFVLGNRIRR